MSVMIERLEGMVNRYHEITDLMMMPEITSDNKQLAKLGREQAELTQVVEAYTEYKQTAEALEQAKALLSEDDKELREMAKMEIEELEPKQEQLSLIHIYAGKPLFGTITQKETKGNWLSLSIKIFLHE